MGRVEGKVAIVTGAASGIGEGIARRLAAEGATVFIADLNVQRGEEIAREIVGRFVKLDVASEQEWSEAIGEVLRSAGQLDILINNAGIGAVGERPDPESTTLEEWQLILKVNGEGVFLGCKAGIEAMKSTGGSIVNMSSIAGLVPTPFLAGYGFSKAGVAHYTRTVALHCAQMGYGIRCNSINPGQIQTPLLDHFFDQTARTMGTTVDEARTRIVQNIPLKEFGTVEDIANGVLYLVSDEGKYITGQQLVIDGGICLNH